MNNVLVNKKICDLFWDEQITINSFSNHSLDEFVIVNENIFLDYLEYYVKAINFRYLRGSAVCSKDKSLVIFECDCVEFYNQNSGLQTRLIYLFLNNVEIEDNSLLNGNKVKNCSAPEFDVFLKEINIIEQTNSFLNKKIEELDFKNENLSSLFENWDSYKNVQISLIPQSANINKKTFKIIASPINEAVWEDNTLGSKIITISVPKIVFNRDLESDDFDSDDENEDSLIVLNDAFCPLADEWNESIYIPENSIQAFREYMNIYCGYFLQNIVNLKNFNMYKNVELSYIGDEQFLNNRLGFYISAKPKKGHAWADGGRQTKFVRVNLNYVYINNVVFHPTFEYGFKQHKLIKSKNTLSRFVDEVFTTDNLKEIFRAILAKFPLCRIDHIVDGSEEMLTKTSAKLKVGIAPKNGYAWIDESINVRIMDVTVTNIYVEEWYNFTDTKN